MDVLRMMGIAHVACCEPNYEAYDSSGKQDEDTTIKRWVELLDNGGPQGSVNVRDAEDAVLSVISACKAASYEEGVRYGALFMLELLTASNKGSGHNTADTQPTG